MRSRKKLLNEIGESRNEVNGYVGDLENELIKELEKMIKNGTGEDLIKECGKVLFLIFKKDNENLSKFMSRLKAEVKILYSNQPSVTLELSPKKVSIENKRINFSKVIGKNGIVYEVKPNGSKKKVGSYKKPAPLKKGTYKIVTTST